MKYSWLLHHISPRRLGWLQLGVIALSFALLPLDCCLSPWQFEGMSWKLLE